MSFVWAGPAYPHDSTLGSFIEAKDDEDVLRTALQMLLFTRKGERVMLRDFGSDLHGRVFDPNDALLRRQILSDLRQAIQRWDDRIKIESLEILQEDHRFQFQLIFLNAKDPLHEQKVLRVEIDDEFVVA